MHIYEENNNVASSNVLKIVNINVSWQNIFYVYVKCQSIFLNINRNWKHIIIIPKFWNIP